MKKIGFIGAYDKLDLIICVSKLLVENKQKVLVIDGTTLQKARYIVPAINVAECYITTHEGIDFAIGFETIEGVLYYMQKTELEYDYILFDIDKRESFENFEIETLDKNFFVTGFDNYSLKKGLEIIGKDENKLPMTKILFSAHMNKEEEQYLNFLAYYYAIKWNKEKIFFPLETGDNSVLIENQRNSRVSFKELTPEYKSGILELIMQIAPEINFNNVKKMMKNI